MLSHPSFLLVCSHTQIATKQGLTERSRLFIYRCPSFVCVNVCGLCCVVSSLWYWAINSSPLSPWCWLGLGERDRRMCEEWGRSCVHVRFSAALSALACCTSVRLVDLLTWGQSSSTSGRQRRILSVQGKRASGGECPDRPVMRWNATQDWGIYIR